jgi:hypothetical protein
MKAISFNAFALALLQGAVAGAVAAIAGIGLSALLTDGGLVPQAGLRPALIAAAVVFARGFVKSAKKSAR